MENLAHSSPLEKSKAPQGTAELLPVVYEELRRLAAQKLAQEKRGQTLQARPYG